MALDSLGSGAEAINVDKTFKVGCTMSFAGAGMSFNIKTASARIFK